MSDHRQVISAGKEEEHKFDREAWLVGKEPYLRKRFEKLFEQQDHVDKLLEALAQERHQLEEKYIKLCGAGLSLLIVNSQCHRSHSQCSWQVQFTRSNPTGIPLPVSNRFKDRSGRSNHANVMISCTPHAPWCKLPTSLFH